MQHPDFETPSLIKKSNGDYANAADILSNSAGGYGAEFVNDTAVHTAPTGKVFCHLQIIADATFSAITPAGNTTITGNTMTGVLIPKGVVIPVRLASFSLTSGTVIAYKGV
jgi:hypothetical protein